MTTAKQKMLSEIIYLGQMEANEHDQKKHACKQISKIKINEESGREWWRRRRWPLRRQIGSIGHCFVNILSKP